MTNKEELLGKVEVLQMLDKRTYERNYYCTAEPIVFDNMRYILNQCPRDSILKDCDVVGSLRGTLMLHYHGEKHFACAVDVGRKDFSYSVWDIDNDIVKCGQSFIKDDNQIESLYLALKIMNQK